MKHCMLLWKKPSAKPLQTQIDCAFDVFSVIRDLREEYSPHFYKANKKKNISADCVVCGCFYGSP